MHQTHQVGLVCLQPAQVGQAGRIHLVVQLAGLDELDDERTEDRLQVVQAKRLEGDGQDLAGDGVASEKSVHTPTLQSLNLREFNTRPSVTTMNFYGTDIRSTWHQPC